MSLFAGLADNRDRDSLASHVRAKRHALFLRMLAGVPRPLTILDLGGTAAFWETLNFSMRDVDVVLLNLRAEPVSLPRFTSVAGDARDLSAFANKSVDVVFSNSVIEHVGGLPDQTRMANEIRRVGRRHFVQTPNRWFPIEPHFLFPGFACLPLNVRASLLTRTRLGWHRREPDWQRALATVGAVRLLTRSEVAALFPESQLYVEHFWGWEKSFVAHDGW